MVLGMWVLAQNNEVVLVCRKDHVLPCVIPIVLFHIVLFGMKNCLYVCEHWQELLASRSLSDSYMLRAANFKAFCLHIWKVFSKSYWPWSEEEFSFINKLLWSEYLHFRMLQGLFPLWKFNLISLLISD